MQENKVDEITHQGTSKFTQDAFKMIGLSILMYTLWLIIDYNLSFESRLAYLHIKVNALLGFTIFVISLNGVVLGLRAFSEPVEEGILKYFAILGNGVLLMIFGVVALMNGLDLLG